MLRILWDKVLCIVFSYFVFIVDRNQRLIILLLYQETVVLTSQTLRIRALNYQSPIPGASRKLRYGPALLGPRFVKFMKQGGRAFFFLIYIVNERKTELIAVFFGAYLLFDISMPNILPFTNHPIRIILLLYSCLSSPLCMEKLPYCPMQNLLHILSSE